MTTALVLSAGGMFAAWEAGVWNVLAPHFRPDLVLGASAGAWTGWAIASGATAQQLTGEWLDGSLAAIRILRPQPLHAKARELAERFRPQIPFGLTVVEARSMRPRLVCCPQVTWRHLAATCSIPLLFPPVFIDGRAHVDGGLMGALPLWAVPEMGARRVIALNCLHGLPFRMLRAILPARPPRSPLEVITITPSERLGSLHDALYWSRANIERWIELGERDGKRALQGRSAVSSVEWWK